MLIEIKIQIKTQKSCMGDNTFQNSHVATASMAIRMRVKLTIVDLLSSVPVKYIHNNYITVQ